MLKIVTRSRRSSCYSIPMLRPKSLRLRNAEVTARARKLLTEFDEQARLQRCVKLQALKTIIALRDMRAVATQTRPFSRQSQEEYQFVESFLLKISRRGV